VGIYAHASDEARRRLNLAFTAHIKVDVDREEIGLASPWHEITEAARYLRDRPETSHAQDKLVLARESTYSSPGPFFGDRGLNMNPLVELRGFEPLTPSMRRVI
jgi:hypothetical protein